MTLIELITVIVIIAILGISLISGGVDNADLSVRSQADKLATDIRQAQTLAFTSGNRILFSASGSAYSATACATGGTDCSSTSGSPLINAILENNVSVSSSSVIFNTDGTTVADASFTLTSPGGNHIKVTITNGLVKVVAG